MEEIQGKFTVRDLLKALEGVDPNTPVAMSMNDEYFWFADCAIFRPTDQPDIYGNPRVYKGPMVVIYG